MTSTKQNHKRWRKEFNEACFERDNHKCVFCNETEDIAAHHITDRHDMPNGGYVMSNGITLCPEHHKVCEANMGREVSWKTEYGDFFTQTELYIKINSTFATAYNDSLNLK